MISTRTKAALEAAKARGIKLGNPNGFANVDIAQGRQLGLAASQCRAAGFRNRIMPIIESIKASGITTIRRIADELNRCGIPAPRGGQWSHTQVFRLVR